MAIEFSRRAEADSMTHAILESKLLALDAEQISEAVAWSFEHPSPKQASFAKCLKDMDADQRIADNMNGLNDGSPTLLAGRRTLLAKGSPCGQVFDSVPAQRGWSVSEEAVHMPVFPEAGRVPSFGDAACRAEGFGPRGRVTGHGASGTQGVQGLWVAGQTSPRVSRSTSQVYHDTARSGLTNKASMDSGAPVFRSQSRVSSCSRHSHQTCGFSRGLSRGDSMASDWSAIIGPEFGHDVVHPMPQGSLPDMKMTGATISVGLAEEEAGYFPEMDRNCSEAAISIFEVEEESVDEYEFFKI